MDSAVLREQKAAARQTSRALRDSMSADEQARLSRLACDKLLNSFDFSDHTCIGLFSPIQSEIDVSLLEKPLREMGLDLALPRTVGRTGMIFRIWKKDAALTPAGFGTVGPDAHAHEVLPDCLIMPLLAFDAECNRLGHGAGHYDRYISERVLEGTKPRLIGLAFMLQKLGHVPVGQYDLPLDAVVTEKDIFAPDL